MCTHKKINNKHDMTDFYDLITNNTTTLINGPTYNSSYNGSIYFDGVDDRHTVDFGFRHERGYTADRGFGGRGRGGFHIYRI